MEWRTLKNSLLKFRHLPFHPQWLVYRNCKTELQQIATLLSGQRILDIGCGEQNISTYLSENTPYYGLDYYETASKWYHTQPHIYGDAQALPFGNASMDAVLLLDVLEHLPETDACLEEIVRVLRPGGYCVLQVPFLYPIHDAPLDFHRWTRYGLHTIVNRYGLTVEEFTQIGKPIETAALLMNIALSKTWLNWAKNKHPAILPGFFLLLLIPLINAFSQLLGSFSSEDSMMPYRYQFILRKNLELFQAEDE